MDLFIHSRSECLFCDWFTIHLDSSISVPHHHMTAETRVNWKQIHCFQMSGHKCSCAAKCFNIRAKWIKISTWMNWMKKTSMRLIFLEVLFDQWGVLDIQYFLTRELLFGDYVMLLTSRHSNKGQRKDVMRGRQEQNSSVRMERIFWFADRSLADFHVSW